MVDFVALVTPPKLLGPTGKPANGDIYVRSTANITLDGGIVAPFQEHGKIIDGEFKDLDGGPLKLVVTPEGVALDIYVEIVQDGPGGRRDKHRIARTVSTPNKNTVTWDELVDVVPVESGSDYAVPGWVPTLLAEAAAAAAPAIAARDAAVAARNQAQAAAASVPSEAQLTATVATQASTPGTPLRDAIDETIAQAVDGLGESKDSLSISALAVAAGTDRQRSLAFARVAYEDAASIDERFADFAAWTPTAANNLQISGGQVYANGSGANSGSTRPWTLGTTGVGRAVFTITKRSGGTNSGGVLVGVSTSVGAPTGGAATARGLYFRPASPTQTVDNGVFADLAGGLSTGVHVVTVVADATFLSIICRRSDGTVEYRGRWARAGFNIQSLYIFNSDANGLTGSSINALSARLGTPSAKVRGGVEDVAPTAQWTAVGTTNVRLALPVGYDSRKPLPVVMMFHGNGSNAVHFADNPNGYGVANAFLAAGYAVLSADNSGNVSTWGAPAGLDAYVAAYKYLRDNYPLGSLVFYGNSMGGLESLLTLAERRIPGVAALILTVPVTNLAENFTNALFTSTIKTAYGIASDGSDYAAKTAGRDPMLKDKSAFRGVPIWALVATDDAAVTPAANWQAFAPLVAPYAAEVVTVTTTGGHSTASIAANAAAMVAFANKYAF